jgi:INO80 complex subunit C
LNAPRPFKNPDYTKNVNRRAKNLKSLLAQERERERLDRERRRQEREERMEIDGGREEPPEEDNPTCEYDYLNACQPSH